MHLVVEREKKSYCWWTFLNDALKSKPSVFLADARPHQLTHIVFVSFKLAGNDKRTKNVYPVCLSLGRSQLPVLAD